MYVFFAEKHVRNFIKGGGHPNDFPWIREIKFGVVLTHTFLFLCYLNNNMAKRLTPMQAILAKCKDCSGYQLSERINCTVKECSLYPYRLGKNPAREGIGGNPNIGTLSKKKTT
jgi:hypothetical protein